MCIHAEAEVARLRERLVHLMEARQHTQDAESDGITLDRVLDPLNTVIRVTVNELDAITASSKR